MLTEFALGWWMHTLCRRHVTVVGHMFKHIIVNVFVKIDNTINLISDEIASASLALDAFFPFSVHFSQLNEMIYLHGLRRLCFFNCRYAVHYRHTVNCRLWSSMNSPFAFAQYLHGFQTYPTPLLITMQHLLYSLQAAQTSQRTTFRAQAGP